MKGGFSYLFLKIILNIFPRKQNEITFSHIWNNYVKSLENIFRVY